MMFATSPRTHLSRTIFLTTIASYPLEQNYFFDYHRSDVASRISEKNLYKASRV